MMMTVNGGADRRSIELGECHSPDDLHELGERCAELYIKADALTAEAMALLAEFDGREGWKGTGFGSTAEWLAWRIGITQPTAKDRLRVARSLRPLPQTAEALKSGALSYSKVRAAVRVACPENETKLLSMASTLSAADLEREVRAWKTMDRDGELTAEQIRHLSRRLSVFVDERDGMYVIHGRLDPETGALLKRVIEAASDALYRGANRDEIRPEQRRADAIGLIAERAMSVGFNGMASGSKAERYQVVLHVDEDTLSVDREPGRSELEDGTRVSAETARRLACDSSVVAMVHGADGTILNLGRKTRIISNALRRALSARDRGCRFPGCGVRFIEGHHGHHWANGGETSLANTLSLCWRHHRAVHEGQVEVRLDAQGRAAFFAPSGRPIGETVPPPADTVPPSRGTSGADQRRASATLGAGTCCGGRPDPRLQV